MFLSISRIYFATLLLMLTSIPTSVNTAGEPKVISIQEGNSKEIFGANDALHSLCVTGEQVQRIFDQHHITDRAVIMKMKRTVCSHLTEITATKEFDGNCNMDLNVRKTTHIPDSTAGITQLTDRYQQLLLTMASKKKTCKSDISQELRQLVLQLQNELFVSLASRIKSRLIRLNGILDEPLGPRIQISRLNQQFQNGNLLMLLLNINIPVNVEDHSYRFYSFKQISDASREIALIRGAFKAYCDLRLRLLQKRKLNESFRIFNRVLQSADRILETQYRLEKLNRPFSGDMRVRSRLLTLKGDRGDDGVEGSKGFKGYKGLSGVKGNKGDPGEFGQIGAKGDSSFAEGSCYCSLNRPNRTEGSCRVVKGKKGMKGATGTAGTTRNIGTDSYTSRGRKGPKGDKFCQTCCAALDSSKIMKNSLCDGNPTVSYVEELLPEAEDSLVLRRRLEVDQNFVMWKSTLARAIESLETESIL